MTFTAIIERVRTLVLGERPPGRLPDRIREAIAREQRQGEILIVWVQVLAVLTFGVLYWLAPKTFPADAPFQPVPWTLAFYAGFIALRMSFAYRGHMAPWFVAVAVVTDIAVLMALIWSFHIQYGQPPAFYLKAPTLLYTFIFIALRALRFEARWVVLSGACAIAGWSALVLYAVFADPRDMPITRDYVLYMTSAVVLFGGEFDKLVSIGMVTAILALSIFRARRLLIRSVLGNVVAGELSRFVARDVAHRIAAADMDIRPGMAERRDAAIMMIDLRGFTPLAQRLGPEATMSLLGEYQMRLVPILQAHGGSIDKFLGDGILASFGATRPSDSYAADAFRAAEAILAECRNWMDDRRARGLDAPAVNLAIAAGPVLFGAIGDDSRLEYTVIGDPVNLAAKLETHNKVEGSFALALGASLDLARAQGFSSAVEWLELPDRRVAGNDGGLDLVGLRG